MKILLINNHTLHFSNLTAALADHEVEVREYHPGLDFSCADKDLVILSGGGGEGLEIHDEHKPGDPDQISRFVGHLSIPHAASRRKYVRP